VRVTTAFSRLLRLQKVWVRKVRFEPDRVIVEVALCRRRLVCPEFGYSTAARKDMRPENSVWRHLDLGVWRLEVHCRRRRLWCPGRIQAVVATLDREELRWAGQEGGRRSGRDGR
jgi:hypothetical protein